MKEIIILSGKGGTGKTSLTASFAALANNAVIADCDVDAADLHLVLNPTVNESHDFISGNEAIINNEECDGCGICKDYCRFDAIVHDAETNEYFVDPASCEGCKVCVEFCPEQCIDFPDRYCGQWFSSTTRFGPMIHARLAIAAENSGKLVSLVRNEARKVANNLQAKYIIVDGSPGIGCPVIASITGADHIVLITEPSKSGKHDIERVLKLAQHFLIDTYICINRWDIDEQLTMEIEALALTYHAESLGRIRYDSSVTQAQIAGLSVVELADSAAAIDIRNIWNNLQTLIN
jgi:MinD superfamily P-loop ATPase